MKSLITKTTIILFTIFFLMGALTYVLAECIECTEVAKGKIPAKFIDKSIKKLPSGVEIWDIEEAVRALKDRKTKILWVDTRPASFLKLGTIKNASLMFCDLKGNPIPKSEQDHAISESLLISEIQKVDKDINNVKVVFFCQGPKCHRSYNAALRSVSEYGLDETQVIWFRDGYPILEEHILNTPKLKKRINRYLEGDVVG